LRGPVNTKGYYKNINGKDIVIQIYKDGPKAGDIATSIVATPNQMIHWGLL